MKRKPYKRKLNARILATARPRDRAYLIWDDGTDGLALCTYPSGKQSWLFIYSRHNRSRWYTIGRAYALGLADARKAARELRVLVDKGIDVQAEKVSQRSKGTFETLAHEYREQFAKKHNRSWAQADYLVQNPLGQVTGELDQSIRCQGTDALDCGTGDGEPDPRCGLRDLFLGGQGGDCEGEPMRQCRSSRSQEPGACLVR